MFKVTLVSHGYTVAAKATIWVWSTDLKHEELLYESLQSIEGTYVPVCLGGIGLVNPYYYWTGDKLVTMLFMAHGGQPITDYTKTCPETQSQIASLSTECIQAIHHAGVLHRDVDPRNMLWNTELSTVMMVDFERSVAFVLKSEEQRHVFGEISHNTRRKKRSGKY